jgi:hypothetical protein
MTEALADALATTEAAPIVVDQVNDTGPSEDDSLGAAFDRIMTNNGSDRGDDGKFTSSKTSQGSEGDAGGETVAPPPAVEASPAPANWNGLDDAWKALPAEHQGKVKAHFDDLHRRMSDQGRQLAAVKPISDHIAQATQALPIFKGMSPEQVSQKALELAAVAVDLKRDPVNTLIQVAQSTGQLEALAARLSGQQMPEANQQISNLVQEVTSLKRQLAAVNDPAQIETTVSRVFERNSAQDVVNQFAADPSNSLWPILEPHLPKFVAEVKKAEPSLSTKDILRKAYDKAVDAFPALKAEREAAAKQAAADADAKRAEAAKRASSINLKSTSTGKERMLTELEALGSAYDRAIAN